VSDFSVNLTAVLAERTDTATIEASKARHPSAWRRPPDDGGEGGAPRVVRSIDGMSLTAPLCPMQVTRHREIMVPDFVTNAIGAGSITGQDLGVFIALDDAARQGEPLSLAALAKTVRRSVKAVGASLDRLEAIGAIRVSEAGIELAYYQPLAVA
jgi:hypothetical protein